MDNEKQKMGGIRHQARKWTKKSQNFCRFENFKSYLILPLLPSAHLTYADGSSWVNFCLCQQTSKLFTRVLVPSLVV